ncbi:MAG: prolyl oligopeptidase family serine peptidase [Planctomycetes bacterium]|nr:prolyl oligopeptidase family serine peptidase [Planctomycetota bacterium]
MSNLRELCIRACLIGVFCVGALAGVQAADKPAPGKQEPQHFEAEVTVKVTLNYLLYLPQDYDTSTKPWPLVLFLHGAGESGTEIEKVKLHGPPKLIAAGKTFPAIVVSPQSAGRGWNPQSLNPLLDDLVAKYRVDKDRIYVTGLSMGGFGTWALAAASPQRFAAIAPICGGGNPADAAKIKHLPIWVFHGAKDNVVPLSASESMVKALQAAGAADVKFTVYPEAAHDSWTETYDNPEFFEWLFKQKRGSSQTGKP